jgi:TIR domain
MAQAVDFFISYTSADRAWAEWIAWQLEAEGYQVVVQAWDFTAGRDWAHEMQQAHCRREARSGRARPITCGHAMVRRSGEPSMRWIPAGSVDCCYP